VAWHSHVAHQLHLQVPARGRKLHGKDGRPRHLAQHLLEDQPYLVAVHDLQGKKESHVSRNSSPLMTCRGKYHRTSATTRRRS
jgi:hypothetical protein